MKLRLPQAIAERLVNELRKAGSREIGGLLMGEHVGDDEFRIVDISVQHAGGSLSCFIREPRDHQEDLDAFFEHHGHDYKRFNYLGEWHSHPSFPPFPSPTDVATMQEIVRNPEVAVNFLVLLIVRLKRKRSIEVSATAFVLGNEPEAVHISFERVDDQTPPKEWIRRIARFFSR